MLAISARHMFAQMADRHDRDLRTEVPEIGGNDLHDFG
jgi:hypothetical protein